MLYQTKAPDIKFHTIPHRTAFTVFMITLAIIVPSNTTFPQPQQDTSPGQENPGSPEKFLPSAENDEAPVNLTPAANTDSGTAGTLPEAEHELSRAPSPLDIVNALHSAYPHRIQEVTLRDDDYALRIDDQWIYFAHSRFLPEDLRHQWEDYDPITFYSYPRELPRFQPPGPEEQQRFERIVEERRTNPPRRHPGLYNAIWRAADKASSYAQVKTIYFLGLQTLAHRDLLSVMAAVEAEIHTVAEDNPEVAAFIDGLAGIEGYSFRRIAETSSLSFHSYGTAVDLVPTSYNGQSPYWLWASRWNANWYLMSYEERYMLPLPVVEIFERHGFIWGGKWRLFDTIHFEYRPEILILNGFTVDTPAVHNHRFSH